MNETCLLDEHWKSTEIIEKFKVKVIQFKISSTEIIEILHYFWKCEMKTIQVNEEIGGLKDNRDHEVTKGWE